MELINFRALGLINKTLLYKYFYSSCSSILFLPANSYPYFPVKKAEPLALSSLPSPPFDPLPHVLEIKSSFPKVRSLCLSLSPYRPHTLSIAPQTSAESFPEEISTSCIFHIFMHFENVFFDYSAFPDYSSLSILSLTNFLNQQNTIVDFCNCSPLSKALKSYLTVVTLFHLQVPHSPKG